MLSFRHYLLLSVVFLSACSLKTPKLHTASKHSSSHSPVSPTPAPTTDFTDPLATVFADSSASANASADLWGRMRKGFGFPVTPTSRYQTQLNFYSRYPSFMEGVSQRGSRFLYYVVDELEKRKMPAEIALIPVIESAYDPKARSPDGAAGLWQMMSGTGKILGLKRNQFYDGRHDVVASTDAALNYLQRLNKKFNGDWHLTLAAYNAGEQNIDTAIARNKAKGLPTDFWSLKLPGHTQTYIPKVLAIRAIINNPSKYQVALLPIPNKPYFARVNINSQISLTAAAGHSGVNLNDLQLLNAGYSRSVADPQSTGNILVPFAAAEAFASALNKTSNRDSLRVIPQDIKLASGKESVSSKPKKTTANTVKTPVVSPAKTSLAASAKGQKVTYTVVKGDSLWSLGERYKVTPDALAQWNNITLKSNVKPGSQLVIWRK